VISVWRIVKQKYAAAAFTGESTVRVAGRWNNAGVKVVYAAASLSLAALENFVHLQNEGQGIQFVYFKVDIPAGTRISAVGAAQLPKDWRACPAADSTRLIGTEWAQKNDSLLLRVPSVVVPSESDYLINPLHHDFHSLKISPPEPFAFDQRMWK
jgi:RES domain-containing protein